MRLHTIWTRMRVQEGKEHIPYYISIDGDILTTDYLDTRGCKRVGRSYTSKIDSKGYHRVAVNKETYITPSLARNVALCFIPNKQNKSEVNHINGNKNDNSVENLEWVTTKENIHHAISSGLREPFLKSSAMKGTNSTIKKYGRIPSTRNSK